MNHNDFRYMRRGKQITHLKEDELKLLLPVHQQGPHHDKALLLLHGFSSSPAVFRQMIPKIKHYDAIVCPILKGHAESIDAFSLATATDWRNTAFETCATLCKQYKQVDVLGLSLGGLLACELSQSFPLNHLFLLAPALKLKMHINRMLQLTKVLHFLGFYHLRNAAGNLMSDEHAEIAYKKLPLSAIIEILTLIQSHEWKAPNCPTDLFLGRHDDVVCSAEVEQLFLQKPNVTIHWLDNSAHVLPLDNDVAQIIDCVNERGLKKKRS